ncbi:MAG: EscU/YscU/HrcU family type III secretion system export apparatus switch protein [Deltaproteobacteria bacterium]|nr:EscU/YscU/HrcU family type III secretion system export apparatus switch protein [Deltaproteobacteria bacterium]
MADQARTEEPTPRRLREARRKGQVARSRDLTAAVSLWLVLGALALAVAPAVPLLVQATRHVLAGAGFAHDTGREAWVVAWAGLALRLAAPVLLAAALAALAAGVVQVGGLFALEAVRPKLDRLDPAAGARRVLGARGWFEALKSVVKFVVVVAASTLASWSSLADVVRAARTGGAVLAGAVVGALLHLGLVAAGLLLLLGALDLLVQRRRLRKDLRMTREEVKREHKEEEGEPALKAERMRLHREVLAHRMVMDVPRATCVIVNPTHLAVALRYDGEDEDGAPIVLAKGEGDVARRIVAAARAAGVPVLRNAPVARTLLACELGAAIPERLYEAVAEVLRIVLDEEPAG